MLSMKNFTLLLACLFVVSSLFAQERFQPNPRTESVFVTPQTGVTGLENYINAPEIPVSEAMGSEVAVRQQFQETIGESYYDLQTNSSNRRLLYRHDDGQLSACWTLGDNAAGWPNRGSGYNHSDGSAWGPITTERLEATTRTGWANVVGVADGTDRIFAHNFTDGSYGITTLSNASGDWVEGEVPTNTPVGVLWPRAAVGGPDGNTIHVIGITTPEGGLGGVNYEGVNGHVLYFRSTDGGDTWDKVDVVLPGIDSLGYGYMSADTYYVDASGETVAIGIFPTWGDVRIVKSTDNGENWTMHTPNDFPVDDLGFMDSITQADIPLDTFAINQLDDDRAIYTTDNSGHLIVDNDGNVHAMWGQTWVRLDPGGIINDGWNFYPGAQLSIAYWNESMGDNTHMDIGGVIDYDGDGAWTVDNDIPATGEAYVSYPIASVDGEGNIFVAYSAIVEYFNENANNNGTVTAQHYRHVHMTASLDGGATWGLGPNAPDEIYDLPNAETFETPAFISAIESTFPSLAKKADDSHVHIVYQQDFEPGDQLTGNGDADPIGFNEIVYVRLDVQNFSIETNAEEVVEVLTSELAPNPATDFAKVSYTLEQTADVSIEIFNLMGQHVRTSLDARRQAGVNAHNINVANLPTGVYLVHLTAGNSIATHKLIVE